MVGKSSDRSDGEEEGKQARAGQDEEESSARCWVSSEKERRPLEFAGRRSQGLAGMNLRGWDESAQRTSNDKQKQKKFGGQRGKNPRARQKVYCDMPGADGLTNGCAGKRENGGKMRAGQAGCGLSVGF